MVIKSAILFSRAGMCYSHDGPGKVKKQGLFVIFFWISCIDGRAGQVFQASGVLPQMFNSGKMAPNAQKLVQQLSKLYSWSK